MESITVGGLTFRWADNVLIITTPTGQHMLNGRATADLLTFLDVNRNKIFATGTSWPVCDRERAERARATTSCDQQKPEISSRISKKHIQ